MTKIRTTISLNEPVRLAAAQLMLSEAFDDFSEFLEYLIREEWKKKCAGLPLPTGGHDLRLNAPKHAEVKPPPNPPQATYSRQPKARKAKTVTKRGA